MAQQTGQWISGAPRTGEVSYDYAAVIRSATGVAAANRAWRACLAGRFACPVATFVYEDVMADQAGALRRLAAFLDPAIDVHPAASERTLRQSGDASRDWAVRIRAELRAADAWILDPEPA